METENSKWPDRGANRSPRFLTNEEALLHERRTLLRPTSYSRNGLMPKTSPAAQPDPEAASLGCQTTSSAPNFKQTQRLQTKSASLKRLRY